MVRTVKSSKKTYEIMSKIRSFSLCVVKKKLSNSPAAFKSAISNIYLHFYYFALISAISVTFVFLCLFVCLFFLELSKMLNIE